VAPRSARGPEGPRASRRPGGSPLRPWTRRTACFAKTRRTVRTTPRPRRLWAPSVQRRWAGGATLRSEERPPHRRNQWAGGATLRSEERPPHRRTEGPVAPRLPVGQARLRPRFDERRVPPTLAEPRLRARRSSDVCAGTVSLDTRGGAFAPPKRRATDPKKGLHLDSAAPNHRSGRCAGPSELVTGSFARDGLPSRRTGPPPVARAGSSIGDVQPKRRPKPHSGAWDALLSFSSPSAYRPWRAT
jgi:hypothetical protein